MGESTQCSSSRLRRAPSNIRVSDIYIPPGRESLRSILVSGSLLLMCHTYKVDYLELHKAIIAGNDDGELVDAGEQSYTANCTHCGSYPCKIVRECGEAINSPLGSTF
jgi:hypothetical protein